MSLPILLVFLLFPTAAASPQPLLHWRSLPHGPVVWQSNESNHALGDCPFPPSENFEPLLKFVGPHANFSWADTWFPVPAGEAAEGIFVSPWTDGKVSAPGDDGAGNVTAFSGCVDDVPKGRNCSSPAETVSQGWAMLQFSPIQAPYHGGAGPFQLFLRALGSSNISSAAPHYHGRYPGASFIVNGTWFYSTYGLGDAFGECGNWCTLGALVGFRYARNAVDGGGSIEWTEPKPDTEHPLFASIEEVPCQFGAARTVNFLGRWDHARYVYITAHSGFPGETEQPTWLSGSAIYLARIERALLAAAPEFINNAGSWEFYSGRDGDTGEPAFSRRLAQARPIASWPRRMGSAFVVGSPTTFLMFVSTPHRYDAGKEKLNTTGSTDSYVLESQSLYGPWRRVVFMERFARGAYFLNTFPQRLEDVEGGPHFVLTFSSNFRAGGDSIPAFPPDSGYTWAFHEVQLWRKAEDNIVATVM